MLDLVCDHCAPRTPGDLPPRPPSEIISRKRKPVHPPLPTPSPFFPERHPKILSYRRFLTPCQTPADEDYDLGQRLEKHRYTPHQTLDQHPDQA